MKMFNALIALAGMLSLAGRTQDRPNIIFLLTDDQRWDALGCNGNARLKTPDIDALARGGVKFQECVCNDVDLLQFARINPERAVHAHAWNPGFQPAVFCGAGRPDLSGFAEGRRLFYRIYRKVGDWFRFGLFLEVTPVGTLPKDTLCWRTRTQHRITPKELHG
jgi:hypothetical protein